jgi:hypothetical protein
VSVLCGSSDVLELIRIRGRGSRRWKCNESRGRKVILFVWNYRYNQFFVEKRNYVFFGRKYLNNL